MTYEQLKALREERAKLINDMNAIVSKASGESRSMTAEENQEWDRIDKAADEKLEMIARVEKTLKAQESLRASDLPTEIRSADRILTPDVPAIGETPDTNSRDVLDTCVRSWIARGEYMPDNERRVLEAVNARDMSQAVATAGGNLVPQNTSFYDQIVAATKATGLDEASLFTVINTDDAGDLPIPTNDDTSNSGSSMQENTDPGSATDLTINQVTLYAHLNTTKSLYVSNKLLMTPAAEPFIAMQLGERIGRRRAAQFTTGTGTAGQAKGLVTAASAGKTAASASAITFGELIDLKHSVDASYRVAGAGYMMADSTWAALKKIVDSQGRPLYQPSFAAGAAAQIDGDPVYINNNMASIATTAKTVLYGNYKKYFVRNAGGLILRRSAERAVEKFQTLFIAFYMADGNLTDTAAVKYLVQA